MHSTEQGWFWKRCTFLNYKAAVMQIFFGTGRILSCLQRGSTERQESWSCCRETTTISYGGYGGPLKSSWYQLLYSGMVGASEVRGRKERDYWSYPHSCWEECWNFGKAWVGCMRPRVKFIGNGGREKGFRRCCSGSKSSLWDQFVSRLVGTLL